VNAFGEKESAKKTAKYGCNAVQLSSCFIPRHFREGALLSGIILLTVLF
jgi:hypothetical protein